MSTNDGQPAEARALASRLFAASLQTVELVAAYIGVRLGLYEALASAGPLTPAALADRARIAPRYAREWLEQQAAAGMLTVADPAGAPEARSFCLPAGYAEALTQPESAFYVPPLALLPVGGIAQVLPQLLCAFVSGAGIPYEQYGEDFRRSQASLNRAVVTQQLPRWIRRALPDVHVRLSAPNARIADIGAGHGWSSIGLARAYPAVHVDAVDIDPGAVAEALENAAHSGVGDRVAVHLGDATAPRLATGAYALVIVCDALHDMARPVDVLRDCRRLCAEDGAVLLMEPRAAETFAAPASETERFLYAISLLHCLPVGLAQQPSAATGTVMRPPTVRAYAREAGFERVRVIPVGHQLYQLYQLYHVPD
jgi:ubiquinone/menaquinone biosynthesis C-methylase UbiE